MEILLLKDVDRLGKAGSLVDVKDGYARNFLLPRGLALQASPSTKAQVEATQAAALRQGARERDKAIALKPRVEAFRLRIPVAVGIKGKLHGAVTVQGILDALREKGIDLKKDQLRLSGPLTQLGLHEIPIRLHPEVSATLKVEVVQEGRRARNNEPTFGGGRETVSAPEV